MSRGRGNCHVDSFVERPMEGESGDRTLQVMERGLTHRGRGSTDGGLREHHRLVGS